MKVKLKGKIFTNPMEYNHISIRDNAIEIHNSDRQGCGYIHKLKNKTLVPDGFDFTLNKKDYSLLGSLDELYLEKDNNKITVISNHFKGKFADMLVKFPMPDISNMEILGITFDSLKTAKNFAESIDNGRPQHDGVTIQKDRIIASNSFCIYQEEIVNNGPTINIPKNVFKYLDTGEYDIKTNMKCVLFQREESAVYTNLIPTLLSTSKLDGQGIVSIETNKNSLLDKLKIIKSYAKHCVLNADHEVLSLKTDSKLDYDLTNEITCDQVICNSNAEKLKFAVNIGQLMKMVSIVNDENVTLVFNDMMMKVVCENIIAASARIGNDNVIIGGAS